MDTTILCEPYQRVNMRLWSLLIHLERWPCGRFDRFCLRKAGGQGDLKETDVWLLSTGNFDVDGD